MLTLIVASLISQAYAKDFAFMQAQETWVMDQAPQGTTYRWVVPKEVLERVDMWLGDDPHRHWPAVTELVAMGEDVIRPMFWVGRSRDHTAAWLSEIVLERLRLCPICHGTGECPGYNGPDVPSGSCKNCDSLQYAHKFDQVRECRQCGGRGRDAQIPGDYSR